MVNLILVTYDLNGWETSDAYKKLKNVIDTSYPSNRKILYSVYILKTTDTAKQVSDRLLPSIDENDSLFCTEIKSSTSYGWIKKEDWARIQS